jgi:hypothetical protein
MSRDLLQIIASWIKIEANEHIRKILLEISSLHINGTRITATPCMKMGIVTLPLGKMNRKIKNELVDTIFYAWAGLNRIPD